MANNLFNKYVWLINTIYRAEKITLQEINNRWLRCSLSDGEEIPKRSFHNYRTAIENLFDVNIECSKKGGYHYYIENKEGIVRDEIRNWLLSTFSVNTMISESHTLQNRILTEDIPSGLKHLTLFIEAMHDNKLVEIQYQGFNSSVAKEFVIEPYAVKVFKQRWYVLARNPYYDKLMIYALDRIHKLSIKDEKFIYPKEFSPKEFFYNSFGISVLNEFDVEKVQIKVWGNKISYFKALPLHHTQKEIETGSDYSIFEYELYLSYDFRQELLAHGCEIEVLQPQSFRDEFRGIAEGLVRLYAKDDCK